MNDIEQAGINKKSFELNYNGGTIWCEHLDSMGAFEEEVIKKFLEDKKSFKRPSVSSYMIINLDETDITENIVREIISNIVDGCKDFKKIAFVGVGMRWRKHFNKMKSKGCVVKFINDFEKAKEWLL